jgi:hypothetical protein
MLITGLSNSPYINNGSLSSNAHVQTQALQSNANPDSVTLSPEAKTELEKLAAFPGWAGEYLPKVNVRPSGVGSQTIGYSEWETRFKDAHQNELNEYNSKFKDYYEETKAEHGIVTRDDYYTKVIAAADGNPAFKQSFENKVSGDPRMLQLMTVLGIKQPG